MKKCIISIKLFLYIILLHKWNGLIAHPTSGTGSITTNSHNARRKSSTPKSQTTTPTNQSETHSSTSSANLTSNGANGGQATGTRISTTTTATSTTPNAVNTTNSQDATQTHNVLGLKFFGEDDSEITSSNYSVTLDGQTYEYKFNDGVNCKIVKYGDDVVWRSTDDVKFESIKAFYVDLQINNFVVKNLQNELKVVNYNGVIDPSKPPVSRDAIAIPTADQATSLTTRAAPSGRPVTLDIDKKASTVEFGYYNDGNCHTYTRKFGHVFNKIVKGTTVICEAQNDSEFVVKVLLEDFAKGKQVLILDNKSGKKMLYRPKEGESWQEVDEKPQNAFETEEQSSQPTQAAQPIQPVEQQPITYSYVTLDLNKTSSTSEFDYNTKNEFATYTPKPGYLFNKVLVSAASGYSKEEVVWEYQGTEKSVKMVRIKLTDNHAALLLNTGELILFHKDGSDQPWKTISDQRHNFSGFKFFTFDQDICEYRQLNSSEYTLGLNEFSYGVTFNVKCHLIKHEDKPIYNYDADQDFGILKGVYLGLVSNKFFLTNFENDNKTLDLNKKVPAPKAKMEEDTELIDQTIHTATVLHELPEQDSTVNIPSANLMSLNIDSSDDATKYQCSDNGLYKTFTALGGNGFNEVKSDNKTFWKSNNNDYCIKVRLNETSNGEKYVILLFVSKKYLVFYSPSKDKPLIDYTDTNHSFYDIKLFTKDLTTSAYKQLNPSSYTLSLYHLSLGYSLKDSAKCHLIKFGKDVIYKYDDHQIFGYIKGVYHDMVRGNLYILNPNDQIKVMKELDRGKTVTVDLNKTDATSEFEYEKNGDLVTYTPLGTAVFDKLIRSARVGSDDIIWIARDINNYAKKIVVDGQGNKDKTKNVTLHLVSGDIKHLSYLDGKWIETYNKVTLDINKTVGTDEIEFSENGEFKTFQAKHFYNFNKIVESAPDLSSEKNVFESPNFKEYASKVVLKDSGHKKYLVMLRVDDKYLLFHKDNTSQNWEDVTVSRLNLSDLKMFYYDDDITEYIVLKDNQYSKSMVNFSYRYEFNRGKSCHLIKFKSDIVWNHDSDPNFNILKGVYLDIYSNQLFVVNNSGVSKEITLPNSIRPPDLVDEEEDSSTADSTQTTSDESEPTESTATPVQVRPENRIELDLTKMENTNEYEYEERDDNHVFMAKSGFGFSKVKKGEHDLKELSDPYSCKVVANYGQAGKVMLHIYRNDKDFDLHIVDDPEPTSQDITSLPSGSVTVESQSSVFSEHLKLLALGDDGTSRELDNSKLKKEDLTHLVNYTFEPDTKCSEIKYDNKTVWQYDKSKHGRYHPTNMLLNTSTNFILVESQGHYQYYYTYINDEWRCISGYKTQDLQPLYPDKLRIFTLNEFGTPVMDDETLITKKFEGPLTTFALNPGSKCIEVKYEGDSIWSYNYQEHENMYPTSVSANAYEKTVMIDSSGNYRYLFSYSAGNFKCVFAFKSRLMDKINPYKLKFFNIDSNKILVELDRFEYDLEEPDTIYRFKPDTKCTCIKYGVKVLWKHRPRHNDNYPTFVSLNRLARNYLVVGSSRSYLDTFQFQNGLWKLLQTNEKVNYDCFSTAVFDVDSLKFYRADPSDANKLVELSLDEYSKESPSFLTYKFKSVVCHEVRYEDQFVWKYDENEHAGDFPTSVSINLKKSYLVVDSSQFYRHVYSYYNKKWKELPFGYKTSNVSFDKFKLLTQDPNDSDKLVELDTSKYEIDCSSNLLAVKFNTDVKCASIMYDKKQVWEYKPNEHEGKYPTTTVFNKKKSIVLVESGYNYRYLYIYQNKEWKPLPYGYTLKSRPVKSQLFDTKKLEILTMDNNNQLVSMSTNEYDKEDTSSLVSYFFIYARKCYCVKYDQKVVWEYNPDEHGDKHPTTVSLNKIKNYMMIESGYDYRYMFEFENKEWKLLPLSYRFKPKKDSIEPAKIKLFSTDYSDPDKHNELTASEYTKDDTTNLLTFKINENVKCAFVRYDDRDVWKYDKNDHGDKFPTMVSLNKKKKFLLVESGYDYRYLHAFQNGEWKLLPFGNKFKSQTYPFNSCKFKLLSTNLSNKTFELDHSKYDTVERGHILTYTFRSDVNCTEVKYGDISVWKHDEDEYESNYPTTVIFNRSNGFLIVESKDNYGSYYSYYDNKWHSVYGYKASKLTKNKEFYKLKLYQTNDDGLSELITAFHEEIIGPVITCNIFYGVKCTHVKFDDKIVWTYDSEKHLNHYPTSVVFNVTNSTIKVECEDQYVHFSSFVNDEWRPFSGFRTQRTTGPSEVKLFKTGQSGMFASINPSKYNVNWDGENNVYEYNLSGVFCTLVKHDNIAVWTQRSGDNQHPKSITYNSDEKKFVLRFEKEYMFCTFEDNQWKTKVRRYGTQPIKIPGPKTEKKKKVSQETKTEDSEQSDNEQESTPATAPVSTPRATPSGTPVTLDIAKKQSTDEYDYSKSNEFHTYTAKSGHVFTKLTDTNSNTDVWESANNISATLVRVRIKDNKNYIAILLENDTFILFHQTSDKNWKNNTSTRLNVAKLKFYGDNDAELKRSDYKITLSELSFGHIFNTGVKCNKIKYEDEVVWKPDDDPKFQEISSFSLGLASNILFFKNMSGEIKKIEPTKVGLDISHRQSTKYYDYSKSGETYIYTRKSVHVFSRVTQKNRLIWESQDNIFGTKVNFMVDDTNEQYLAILLENDTFRLFHQPPDDTWKDITEDKGRYTNISFLFDKNKDSNSSQS